MWLLLLVLSGCASVRLDVPRVPSHAIDDGQRTTLGRVFAEQVAQHPSLSGFQLLVSGHAAFVARTALAEVETKLSIPKTNMAKSVLMIFLCRVMVGLSFRIDWRRVPLEYDTGT